MKIGIIQGRLSPPVEGWQETPDDWRREFSLLPQLGLSHIEWIVSEKRNKSNPLFHDKLKTFPISSVCADVLVSKNILDNKFLRTNLIPICEYAMFNRINTITIPLLEDSSVIDKEDRTTFLNNFLPIVDGFPDLKFSLEAELDPEDLLEIVEQRVNLYVTYDTGNITSFGSDHEEYIDILSSRINNVHLKDRTYSGKTVQVGRGDTDFELIFKKLKAISYNGIYTLQTCREEEGKEVETLASHLEIFRRLG
tara:strand:+ start:43464 stop:44219 length:756 start_codon:yes stop_codon:yes gene_type:complete